MKTYDFAARVGGTVTLSEGDVSELEGSLRGGLLRQGDRPYERARRLWNGMVDRRPQLIVLACSTADVAAGVRFARDHGVRLSVRGGGHNVSGKALVEGGVVIDLADRNDVRVDPVRKLVRVGGGALLGDVDHETQAHGMAVPLGLVSETGVGGLTLHGGVGWLTRKRGLTVDNLVSADLVTADGRIRVVDARHDADLFWAIRGGGGGFGAVTSLEFDGTRVGPEVYMVMVTYPLARAAEVLLATTEFMKSAPEELGLIATLWTAEGPDFPEDVRGGPVVMLLGGYAGPVSDGEKVTQPLRSIGEPVADASGVVQFTELQQVLDEDYPNGRHYYWKSIYLDEFNDQVAEILAEYTRRRPSSLSSLDVWFLEGAPQRVPLDATAFYPRRYKYMVGIEANWVRPDDDELNVNWARSVYQDLRRVSDGATYLNFPGFAEEGEELGRDAFGPNWERLKRVKREYDPEGVFSGIVPLDQSTSAG